MKTVLLECGTVGKTSKTAKLGEVAKVSLQDESGLLIEVSGKIKEILEEA